jgi:ABC-type molybdate transport system permease subunit
VLFEPFPWEINNFNSGLAAGENLFILWFVLSRAGRLRRLFHGIVRKPYLLFSIVFGCLLLIMFSFLPNLGLLSRERAQLLPFVFAPLVAAETVRKRAARHVRLPLTGAARISTSAYRTYINANEPQTSRHHGD